MKVFRVPAKALKEGYVLADNRMVVDVDPTHEDGFIWVRLNKGAEMRLCTGELIEVCEEGE